MSVQPAAKYTPRDSESARELALVWPLLGRHIAFHRRLVDITRSVKAAVMLSQIIYWTRHGRDIESSGGWFYKTSAQWHIETALSAREQEHARELLLMLGLVEERRRGIPARLHFRLNPSRLATRVGQLLGHPDDARDAADSAAVFALLGPPLAYHRTLAAVSGGVHAGLLLSRSLYLTRYPARNLRDGWFHASRQFWDSEIGLGRREQETARRALVSLGLWNEAIRGIPPRTVVCVCMDVLIARLRHAMPEQTALARAPDTQYPEGGISAINTAAVPPSSRRDDRHPQSTNPPIQFRQKRHDSFNKSAQSNVHSSTGCLVQEPPRPQPPAAAKYVAEAATAGGGDLILPQKLLPEERAAALTLVSRYPAQAQVLLDELSGRLQQNAIHTSPIAYLRALLLRARTGRFVPELAPAVAAARRQEAEQLQARRQHDEDLRRLTHEQHDPVMQARATARRQQLQELLASMRARTAQRRFQES